MAQMMPLRVGVFIPLLTVIYIELSIRVVRPLTTILLKFWSGCCMNSPGHARSKAIGRDAALGGGDAAIPDVGLRELLAPNLTFSPISRGRHCDVEFEDYSTP